MGFTDVNPTKNADKLKKSLEKLGIKVEKEYFDGYKHIDLFIPSIKVNIEVDGIQHLIDSDQIGRDFSREYYAERAGYHTLHIPNILVNQFCDQIAQAIAELEVKKVKSKLSKLIK